MTNTLGPSQPSRKTVIAVSSKIVITNKVFTYAVGLGGSMYIILTASRWFFEEILGHLGHHPLSSVHLLPR